MSAEVIPWGGVTKLDIDPDRILEAALGKLDSVIIAGYDKDGEYYCKSSLADGADALWLMEVWKHKLLQAAEVAAPDKG